MTFHDSTTRPEITYIADVSTRAQRPGWRLARRTAMLLACFGVAAVTACSASFSLGDSPVEKTSDIAVGECLTIGDEADDQGKVRASKTGCDSSDGLTFYAASAVTTDAVCAGENSASLSFPGDPRKLCMTPNFVNGDCYQIPLPGGELIDYRNIDCAATPASTTVVAEAVTRSDESVSCPDDLTKWSFTEPNSLGYCLRALQTA
ncbi:hypothetical protein [Gordonia soli]|uniref:Pyridine nucleotide-disulfide oxidoreductase n=1 Tax=Gordonia soli NBRC 108243 TaxID=1223545 RepID=M0QFX3_9ACTN|nr:hypothetical protein [Gordonia soli]GAC67515.1 hypothetical protein GS4_08_01000 [Gordonia soli NBRC 108243]